MRTLKVFIMSVLLLACCSWLMVSAALAEDGGGGSHNFGGYGIIYGPTSTGTDDFGAHGYKVGCYAPDRYFAAYLLCSGNNANFDVVLTDEQKAYLSNASTGGGFYELAQKFVADAMPIYVLQYGEGNTWFAEYNNHDLDAAIESLQSVLNGGGGSGGTVQPDQGLEGWYSVTVTANCPPYRGDKSSLYYANPQITLNAETGKGSVSGNSNAGTISYATQQNIKVYIDPYSYNLISTNGYEIVSYIRNYTSTYLVTMQYPFTYVSANSDNSDSNYYVQNLSSNTNNGRVYTSSNYRLYLVNGEICAFVTSASPARSFSCAPNKVNTTPIQPLWNNYNGEVNNPSTPVPPTNWPDTPENPTPTEPDVPIHTGHGIDDLPEPDDYIEQPTYVTNVFTADLQGVIDALDEHCQHLQNAMYSNFQGFYDDITDFIWQVVQWLGSNINDMLNDLCDYLHDLFEWLADQFDFSVSGSGYNDNTVVSWLRRIYARLGGGTNTRPTDPVADPFDFGEWLAQLFGNFVGWLFGLGSDAVSGLVEDFQTLITKFPFSIPWDLGAMLALLVTAPVTPVFEFPCYTFSGSAISQVGTYRIDLSAWDDVMNTVRPMEVMVFAFWLAFKIDFFKGIIELNRN